MTRPCPTCGSPLQPTGLTAAEEQAQRYPVVAGAMVCARWPDCDTRVVDWQEAKGASPLTSSPRQVGQPPRGRVGGGLDEPVPVRRRPGPATAVSDPTHHPLVALADVVGEDEVCADEDARWSWDR